MDDMRREHAILKAGMLSRINRKGIQPANSSEVTRKIARFLSNPEFKGLGVTVTEYRHYYVKWCKEALEGMVGEAHAGEEIVREHAILKAGMLSELTRTRMPSINSSQVQNKIVGLLARPEFGGLGVTLREYGDYYVKWGKEAMDVKALL